jgi:hypothetical protein
MIEYYTTRVNRCRPGHGASCAFCCGSHNYTVTPGEIEYLFGERGREGLKRARLHQDVSCSEKLFPDAIQCSHVGMDPSEPGIVCCLLYGEDDRGEDVESFFNGTCKNFYCPAWDDLTDRQVLFAARLMGDWYFYSLLINDIEAVHDLCASYDRPEDVPPDELGDLKQRLTERLMDEDGK